MSGITSSGRVGAAIVPHWRWEDDGLDSYELRVAGWLASHTNSWREDHVTRNMISRRTGVSTGKVSSSIEKLVAEKIITVKTIDVAQSQGGKRWVINVNLDVWQSPYPPGHVVTDPGHVVTDPGHVVTDPGHVVTATTGISVEKERETMLDDSDLTLVSEPDGFAAAAAAFWKRYPNVKNRKVDKAKTLAKFVALCKQGHLDELRAGFKYWEHEWADPTKRDYCPQPFRWLNSGAWTTDAIGADPDVEEPVSFTQSQGFDMSLLGDLNAEPAHGIKL